MKTLIALALPLFLVGCHTQFPTPGELRPDAAPAKVLPAHQETAQKESALQVTTKTSKATYKSGEPVEFTITLKNTGDNPQNVEFSSGQNFDITVKAEDGEKPIWRWAEGRFFTLAIRNEVLNAGEERTWTAKWDQQTQNSDGEKSPAPRGTYVANAKITVVGGLAAPAVKFTLAD